jgi:excinuclease UvrABC ATPase subunit
MPEGDHEEELGRLLAELGETLGRRERVLEGMKRTRTQARLHEITVEADQPFERWDQEMLVEDLQRELEHQQAQELELQRVVDLLERQRELEDRLFEELNRNLAQEHRNSLAEVWRRMEQRDACFESIRSGSLQEKRRLIPEAMELQRELEDRLFRLIERHLAHRNRA